MNIYLINGESYLIINEEINNIVKDSKNIATFDLNLNTLEEAILEAGYLSIFADSKYIVIKNANFFGSGKLSEKDTNMLLNYLANPNSNSTLIFICNEKIDLRKKITKIIKEKYTLKTLPNLKTYEIENRVNSYLNKISFKIEADALKYLISNNMNNYDLVMNEVNKIVLYYDNPGVISYQDVLNLSSKTINTNNFLLVDAIVNNDLAKSLELYNDLKTLKVEPSIIISLIYRDFRLMLNIKKMLNEGLREYNIMNELGLMDWQFNKYVSKVFPYKIKELEAIICKLADLDLNIKSGKVDRFMGLELFILDICS